ncbi:MAG: type IV secretion system protein VirB10 [Caldimonas sp.]
MNDRTDALEPNDGGRDENGKVLTPLPGEAGIPDVAIRPRVSVSKKGVFAVAFFVVSLVAVSAISVERLTAKKKSDDVGSALAGNKPAAATLEPRRLDMTPVSTPASAVPRIPALVPTAEEATDPIDVRRTGPTATTSKSVLPEDAPVLLVTSRPQTVIGKSAAHAGERTPNEGGADDTSANPGDALDQTRRNLDGYQRQLQVLLDTLSRTTAASNGASNPASQGTPPAGAFAFPSATPLSATPHPPGLFGGQLQGSVTPRVSATMLHNRSLTLPKGTAFTCALKTKVVSAASGLVGCQVQRNVYGDDGRVLLIERGSHMDGEYRITSVRPGTVRIPVLWTRIRTPNGVTVDIDSPGTGPLGESGIDGYVDNRWGERIGAAMLLSVIDDSVKLVIQNQGQNNASGTVVLPSTTSNTSKLAEKVLDSTINIPPLIYQNQGGIVGIYVARDVDFSSVYELKAVAR